MEARIVNSPVTTDKNLQKDKHIIRKKKGGGKYTYWEQA